LPMIGCTVALDGVPVVESGQLVGAESSE